MLPDLNSLVSKLSPNKLEKILTTEIFTKIAQSDFSFLNKEKDNTIDFSGSHGLASIISILNKLLAIRIKVDQCKQLLRICCEFILKNKTITKDGPRIPDYLDNQIPKISPLRWCHGELGIVPALTLASKHLNDEKMYKSLSEIVLTISAFKLDKQQELVSTNICHGTLGVAHIFQRLHELYPLDKVKEAARYWYHKSDQIMHSKIGYKDNDDKGIFVEKTGVLMGIEGIALAILSKIYVNQSNWDHQILLR